MRCGLLVIGAVLAAGCAPRRGGTAVAPAPASPGPASSATEPTSPIAAPKGPESVRYGPSALRYLVHRRVHTQQALGGQEQATDVGARIYVAAAITGPADGIGYPTTFMVDSIVPDSGTPPQVAAPMSRARRLIFSGRVSPRGEFVNSVPSDSALAQSLVQVLANFREFLPRIPADGLKPTAVWTDTLQTTQKGAGSEVSRRAVVQSTTAAWEEQEGQRRLRLEANSRYEVGGNGQNANGPFELSGTGTTFIVSFLAADGRYWGGESHDSTAVTVRLPVQGVAVPVIQLTHTTVAVLP